MTAHAGMVRRVCLGCNKLKPMPDTCHQCAKCNEANNRLGKAAEIHDSGRRVFRDAGKIKSKGEGRE